MAASLLISIFLAFIFQDVHGWGGKASFFRLPFKMIQKEEFTYFIFVPKTSNAPHGL